MNILITGGAGYIGSTLCKALINEHSKCKAPLSHCTNPFKNVSISVFDNLMFDQWVEVQNVINHRNIQFYYENILNWSNNLIYEIRKADYIIPLAAIVGAPACDKYPELATELNYEWYKRLLDIIKPNQHIIYPNTNSGYGTTEMGTVCTEETPTNPISLYGITKKQTEELLLKNHKNTVVFRLATVFGLSYRTRLDLLVNYFVYQAVKQGHLDVYDGHFKRNFVSVQDVARAFIFAIYKFEQMKGNVYNLGTDELNCTKLEYAQRVKEVIPCVITEHSSITDPDQRNYMVSNKKLYDMGFYPEDCSLYPEIKKLRQFCSRIKDPRNMLL